MALVSFYSLSSEDKYNGITTKDPNALYFVETGNGYGKLYKGNTFIGAAISKQDIINSLGYTPAKGDVMTGATTDAAGKEGMVPAPAAGSKDRYLSSEGNWTTPPDNKVLNTLAPTTKAYITGTTSDVTNTGTQVFDTGVYLDAEEGVITAKKFNGMASHALRIYAYEEDTSDKLLRYNIPFHGLPTDGYKTLRTCDGLAFVTKKGTTSEIGESTLSVGNNISAGTDGNRKGFLRLYSQNTGFGYLLQAETTINGVGHILPATSGTLLNDHTFNKYAPTKTGEGASGTWGIDITGNSGTATKLETARTFTIGNTAKSFDGGGNISWNLSEIGAAAALHTHGSSDITSLDAGKITGVIGIDHLPQGALERVVTVADDAARFKLTTSNVQLGDTVKVTNTGRMYIVIDESKLSSSAGYMEYTAGSASQVPWSGVTGKPSTFPPSSHTHTYSQITDAGTHVYDATASRTANTVLAAPNGSNGVATFRKLVAADIPALSYAGASSSGGNAYNANALYLNPTSRQTSANINLGSSTYNNRVTYMLATSSMTTGKPPAEGHILSFGWDTTAGWGSQLAIGDSQGCHLYLRGSSSVNNASSWEAAWRTVLDSGNYNSYAPTKTGGGASGTWGISISGSAPTLTTARNINGTAFNGSANITTALWGTARTITIGNTGKSVNGGANVSWSLSEIGAAASSHTHPYLPLSGGTITGNVAYNMYGYTGIPLKVYGGDQYGHGVSLGDGGAVIVGGGESARACESLLGAGTEELWLTADSNIRFYTNCNTIGNKVGILMATDRTFRPDVNNTGYLGTSSYRWATVYGTNMYATTFHGALDGNATTSSGVKDSGSNSSTTTFAYSKAGLDTTSWLAAWNGYELRAISPLNVRNVIESGLTGYYGSDTANTAGWYKVMTVSQSGYSDYSLNLLLTSGYGNQNSGILRVHTRCNNSTAIDVQALKWMYRFGFGPDHVRIVTGNNTWSLYVYRSINQYGRIEVKILSKMSTTGSINLSITNNTTKETSAPGGTASSDGAIVNMANLADHATYSDQVAGTYSGNGGAQPPSFVSGGRVKFAMMNSFSGLGGFGGYCDCMIMDTYTGNDVPYTTAFGMFKSSSPRAWIAVGQKGHTSSWTKQAELITSLNIGSQTVANAANLSGFKISTTTNLGIDTADTNQAIGYVAGLTKATWNNNQSDGAMYKQSYSANWIHQIFGDYRTGQIAVRGKNNGTWTAWRTVLDSSNYTIWVPTKTGSGASGTWGINITGSAGSASSATNADKLDGYHGSSGQAANTYVLRDGNGYAYFNYINSNTTNSENPSISQIIVTNGSDNYYRKASLQHLKNSLGSMPPASHTHSYIPLSGGTMTSGQIARAGSSTSWVTGRNAALIRTTSSGASQYCPILSCKSENGSWEIGTYTSNILHFTYITDANFNAGTNTQTADVSIGQTGTITAAGFNGELFGNAASATRLKTARTINGTSFNGGADITTANWGTARTITIGSTGKSVNGSANISWSLSEIGAAAASHSHSYLPLSGGTLTGSLTLADGCNLTLNGGTNVKYINAGRSLYIQNTNTASGSTGAIVLKTQGYSSGDDTGFTSGTYSNSPVIIQNKNGTAKFTLGYDATGNFIQLKSAYTRTTSSTANVYVNSGGTMMRHTSATKYKLDIKPIEDDSYYYNILKINPKTWFDKASVEAYAKGLEEETNGNNPEDAIVDFNNLSIDRAAGLIAEDVEAAGLSKYCQYEIDAKNNKKEIEGIQYDKLGTLLIPIVRDLVLTMQEIIPLVQDKADLATLGKLLELRSKFELFDESQVIK